MPVFAQSRHVRILGTGVARPDRRVESAEIDARLGLPAGTVQRRSGVRARFVETQRSASALAAEAARQALCAARLTLSDIDCIVAASASMDQAMPYNAALIHRELGLGGSGVPAIDVGASCLGFLAAIDTLSWPIAAGHYRRVLVVAADIASCALDWSDLGASAIFGDGAAAAVLGPGDDSSSSLLGSFGWMAPLSTSWWRGISTGLSPISSSAPASIAVISRCSCRTRRVTWACATSRAGSASSANASSISMPTTATRSRRRCRPRSTRRSAPRD
jgi:3-hydroxy-3-methylglutaryl CoA synthase